MTAGANISSTSANLQTTACLKNHATGALRLFKRAIVRIPGNNFADGLTTVDLGMPHFDRSASPACTILRCASRMRPRSDHPRPDLRYPDSTFVEDAAILTSQAPSSPAPALNAAKAKSQPSAPAFERFFPATVAIELPRHPRRRRHLRSRKPLLHRHLASHQSGEAPVSSPRISPRWATPPPPSTSAP